MTNRLWVGLVLLGIAGCPSTPTAPGTDAGGGTDTGTPGTDAGGTDAGGGVDGGGTDGGGTDAGAGCGNGVVEGSEICDGTALRGATCVTLGYASGALSCESDCSAFDRTACDSCGNNTRNAGEACDGTDLASASCTSLGFASGTLACGAGCLFDTTACVPPAGCPNGMIDGTEVCDGTMLGGATCVSLGFGGGTLGCLASCAYDLTACTPEYVGRIWMRERETGAFFYQPQNGLVSFGPGSAPIGWTPDGAVGAMGPTNYQPLFGDFDGDGNVDIGVREDVTGAIFIRYGDGADTFTGAATPTVGWTPDMPTATPPRTYQALAGDFDGDGRTDVALRERQTGSFYFRFATASRGFGPSSAAVTWTADGASGNTYLPFAADFDGDGLDEIGVREDTTGHLWVRENTSSVGSLSFAIPPTPTLTWYADHAAGHYQPIAADFDLDGRSDIGLRIIELGAFYVRFQNGDGTFTGASTVLTWQPDGVIGGSPPGPRTYQPAATAF